MMPHSDIKETFLHIIRLGIGTEAPESSKDFVIPGDFNWNDIQSLAEKQGLAAVFLDGIGKLPETQRPPKVLLLQWIGDTLQHYEYRFKQCQKTLGEMAGFYHRHGYKMMVLKGYSCCLDWPTPEHRPVGDIDMWQFGKQKEADALLESLESAVPGDQKFKKIKIDRSHHHHTVFHWRGFMVENHYDFINVHHHKSNVEFEAILKQLGQDDSNSVELIVDSLESLESGEKKVEKAKVYLPSPNLHALFLLKHTMNHFAAERIYLRQILDWGFFVKAHGKDVNWDFVIEVLERFNMREMFNILNAICIEDFGFESGIFPDMKYSPSMKEKVLNEILSPQFGDLPKTLLPRVSFKIRRWFGSTWKHKLCYNDSLWSALWSGIKNHLLKPSSI